VIGAFQLSIPVSTSHAAVGAISGTSFAAGEGPPKFGLLSKILVSRILTVPAAGIMSAVSYLPLAAIFL
jgi:PiT family inorganic phosphate transporter